MESIKMKIRQKCGHTRNVPDDYEEKTGISLEKQKALLASYNCPKCEKELRYTTGVGQGGHKVIRPVLRVPRS